MPRKPNWSTLSARIQWIIDTAGMSKNLLSEKCGYSNGYVGRIPKKLLNPKADVGHRLLERVCAVTKTDFGWLSTGLGWPDEKTRGIYEDREEHAEEPPPPPPTKSDILPRSPFGEVAPAKRKRGR